MIVIVDYGMGNLGSIYNMLRKIGKESIITSDKKEILNASKLILPGVGAFDNGMKGLEERDLIEVLTKKVIIEETPILGICLGMQLFTKKSEEGNLSGLGWIDANTVKFSSSYHNPINTRVPHMGWNTIDIMKDSRLFEGMNNQESRFYFVHSFYVEPDNVNDIAAITNYGIRFTSIIEHKNIYATQFHPEKSHKFGMKLLNNFSEFA